jgi:WD40 repeat protein
MRGSALAGATDEIRRMQDGVRDWARRTARHAGTGQDAASPAALLSLLCASAFCPLLMAGDTADAGIAVLSPVGGVLAEAVTDALAQVRRPGQAPAPSRDELEQGVAGRIQQALAAGDQRADALRHEIATVLKEIDAGGTALRAAMEETDERARAGVVAAIGVLGADVSELGFLIKDAAKAAEEIQQRLDAEGANARAIAERSERRSADVGRAREDLAVSAGRATPAGTGGPPAPVHGCPYRGLLPFGEADAEVFRGRERLAAELAARLAARVTRGGLVVVTGAAGAGKSSLLRAGLLPILARGQQLPGSDRWPRIVMTPARDPLTGLAGRLAAIGGGEAAALPAGLAQHPDRAHLAIRPAVLAATSRHGEGSPAPGGAARLVLIVDQFEQVFTLNPGPDGEAQRRAFITALHAAATFPAGPEQQPPALVVIAVRGEFWDECAAYPQLAGALQDGQFVVGPMSEPELRAAITGPADAAGLHIDPALTGTILGDLRAAGGDRAAGALPLLSQAMALTWEEREADRLTSHGYDRAGGVGHATATGADKVYAALPAGRQALARDLLRSMTATSPDGRVTGRPLTRDEFYSAVPGADEAQADAVLEALVAGRLVVIDDGKAGISQDILLRAWPRLRGWLAEDQASSILYDQLADAAGAWHDRSGASSLLYRGTHLATLQQAAARWSKDPARYPALTSTQRDFLQASEGAAARRGRRRRGAVALLAVAALAAVLVFAFQLRGTALQQRDQAIYSQTVAEALRFGASNTPLAAQLNLAAYRLQPTQDLASRLLDAENTPLSSPPVIGTGGVGSVAFRPGDHTLASGNVDGTVRLWDVADPARPVPLGRPLAGTTAVYSVAFSPDGTVLASGTYGGLIQLWNVADPTHPVPLGQPLTAGTGALYSVMFSPDGRTLASGDSDGTVRLWNVAHPARPRALGPSLTTGTAPILSVAFSPDGRTLASGGDDGTVRLWDVARPAHPRRLGRSLAGGSAVFWVAFSPGGRALASGGEDGAVRLWDVADPAHPRSFGQPLSAGSAVFSVAFSPDGHALASGDGDGTVRLWDVADPAHPRPLGSPLTGGTGAVLWVAFSPDGHTVASGSYDGTVRLWSLPATVLTGGTGAVDSVAFSPGGHVLAAGSRGGTVRLWGVADPAHPVPLGRPLTVGATAVDSVAFSADGHTLAVGSHDGTIRLWDVADLAHPVPLGPPLTAGSSVVYSVAFSRDGQTLASGGDDATVWLWDVADPAHPVQFGRPLTAGGVVGSVAFSPDGHTLASATYGGTVRLWGVADPARPRPLGPPLTAGASAADSVAFSRDGRTLAVGSHGGAVRLWDVADPARPRPLGPPLTAGASAVGSVAFSRDGRTLAVGSYDGAVRLWNLNVGYAIERICTTAGGLTPQQWHRYIPQLPYQPSCEP